MSGQNELYVSFYLRLDSLPGTTSTPRLVRIVNSGSATTGNIVISGNKLQLRNNSTTVATAATALSANTTYRVVIHQKKGTGSNAVLEAWYAEGDNTLALFAQKTDATFTTTTVDVSIGTTNGQALQARFDNIDIDTSVLPGPSASVRNQYVAQVNATSIPVVAQAKPAHSVTKSYGNVAGMPLQQTTVQTRTVTYGYDGLNRLTSAQESGLTTNSYTYAYDRAGNRTDGGRMYDAVNQVNGWTYDDAGNLTSDGTTSYSYDALGRVTTYTSGGQQRTNTYNGDGTLVQQVAGANTTRYTQDLASPLSQVLAIGTTTYVYGNERLYTQTSGTKTWYGSDALGSVRQTVSNVGIVQANTLYDPWGQVEQGSVSTFGFTGEVQDGANVYLRARWYNANVGTFTAYRWRTDESHDTIPYSHHPYQYSLSNPINLTDPSGRDPWWVEPKPLPENHFPTPYEAIERKGRDCAYAQIMHAPDIDQYCGAGPGTSLVVDAVPVLGDVKGFAEVFTGCDLLTGEDLGAWRWAGLVGLSELRWLRRLGKARLAAEYGEEFWQSFGGRILREGEYEASKFPILKQPREATCLPTCARMAEEGLAGQASDILDILNDQVTQNGGMFLEELEPLLKQRGWQTGLQDLSTRQAVMTMADDLEAGDAVIAGIYGHAVLVRSIEQTVGNTLIVFNDPATGKVVELGMDKWSLLTGGRTQFISISP